MRCSADDPPRDLADAAAVSVATVNRVLAGAANVRAPTRLLVQEAAERIGFYGLGTIQSRVAASRPKYRFGVLLLQPHRPFYQNIAAALRRAVAEVTSAEIDLRIEFLEDLSPQNTADRALALAKDCQALCIVAAVHPIVTEAVAQIQARGVHVFALVGQLSATGQVPYIGLDNWKVGRTAAWTFANVCKTPGKIGILLGNPRYRNQEMNEAGFRSYFREMASEFTLLEPLSTFEASAIAQEMTEKLLAEHPDLVGLYISGGGISGALAALRSAGKTEKIVAVGYDLFDVTRSALLDGTMTLVISHPLDRLAHDAMEAMVAACAPISSPANLTRVVPFEIYTRENL
ncbi:LacI family DNA-binding transcriptional regulator (plasmid) [Gemmobacter fulvus]|uniref:LacI family DNA-binding transcriptional regulator n=1 Tax=Gemmobacter fulvus TaxID=2840474 RepID=A0A975PAS4_9RHOB|nr:LacI family DNA-binding transcriptional regulator [Gemmobacter fulvus]MBT9247726.1 LacI family DNA-binding transcriptional regulator [Gemmobacter fulvus]QWK92905.1 LacI family DNA-binding transcriptional regulator [Gemmobacter fulvus]